MRRTRLGTHRLIGVAVLVVIAARGGSRTVPRKNLAEVAGRPLIAHAIDAALSAEAPDRVIVSTDDEEIAGVARKCGAEVPFMRPPELATDDVSLIPVAAHAAATLADAGWPAELVVSVQPTTPFLRPKSIDAAIRLQLETGCDSVVGVARVTHNHPYRLHRLAGDGRIEALYPEGESYLQKQDLPPFHAICGALYVRRRALLEGWSGADFCLGDDRRAIELTEIEAVDVDTPLDLALCRALANRHAAPH